RLHRHAMKTIGDGAVFDLQFELRARDAALQSDIQFSTGFRVCDIPHLRFWLAAQYSRELRRWMNLQRKLLLRVENFDQQWKYTHVALRCSKEIFGMIPNQPMQRLPF